MLDRYLIKFRILSFLAFIRRWRFLRSNQQIEKAAIRKIAVLYSIPLDSPRVNSWNDGFVAALNIIKKDLEITMINIDDQNELTEAYLNSFDFLLVKSNWDWGPDRLLRQKFPQLKVKKGLAIAGVSLPPFRTKDLLYYDVLWYETKWYSKVIANHPRIFHAFGINKGSLIKIECPKDFDFISIGAFLPHKRMEKIIELKGKVLVVGEKYGNRYSNDIYNALSSRPNCTMLPFVAYEKLGEYICRAKTMYIPATINGGGERAILEARYLGADIKVEHDNPKLKELIVSDIWDEYYYSEQLLKGILSVC